MTSPLSSDELWQTLGRLAAGVSVITAGRGADRHGMTASAVMPVSHEPPLLAVAVKHGRKLHDLLSRDDALHFGVNVLSSTQKSLSEHFAGKHLAGKHLAGKPNDSLTLPWFDHEGLPLLGGSIAQIVCRKVQAVPVGDHTLFIGHIEYTRFTDDDPLVYFRGQYHELG